MSKTKKLLIAAVCLVAILTSAVVGTIAWLKDETDPVKNTFSPSNINITLTESQNLDLQMVPGKTIAKDPTIAVLANSEACWLFVKIDKVNNFDKFMEYTVADGWTALEGVSGVYYRQVLANTAKNGDTYPVLKGNVVTVKNTVTNTDMKTLYDANGVVKANSELPTLTFTAYAIQSDYLNYGTATEEQAQAAVAWAAASAQATP